MFTDCPDCSRQFRINAAQLSAAEGLVQCGFCGRHFNALTRLRDAPLPVPAGVPSSMEPEPEFNIPGAAEGAVQPFMADPGKTTAPTPRPVEIHISGPLFDATDAEVEESEPPRSSPMRRLFWSVFILVLVVAVLLQVAWFQRDAILERYPKLTPWARRICELVQCDLIRHRDLSAIKLINRDVREHPRFENALLVNATMSNQSQTRQPYPNVQLVLFDTNGDQIAYRDFRPEDYLDSSIDILDGMAPGVPVHFVLEVTGPTAGAVSFEFNFY